MADWRVSGDELIRNEELIDGIAECWLDGGMLTMRETNCAEEAEGGGGTDDDDDDDGGTDLRFLPLPEAAEAAVSFTGSDTMGIETAGRNPLPGGWILSKWPVDPPYCDFDSGLRDLYPPQNECGRPDCFFSPMIPITIQLCNYANEPNCRTVYLIATHKSIET